MSAEEGTVTFGFWFLVQVSEIPSRSARGLQKLQYEGKITFSSDKVKCKKI